MTDSVWRVQWYGRPDIGEPERPAGRHDFDTEAEARAYYNSAEVQPLVGPYWRAELQVRPVYPWSSVEGTGYRPEQIAS